MCTHLIVGDVVALLAGHPICNSQVAGSSPGWASLHMWPRASYLHLCASVTKQYNLVLAKGLISGCEGNRGSGGK